MLDHKHAFPHFAVTTRHILIWKTMNELTSVETLSSIDTRPPGLSQPRRDVGDVAFAHPQPPKDFQ